MSAAGSRGPASPRAASGAVRDRVGRERAGGEPGDRPDAADGPDLFDAVLVLLGRLNYVWTNTESLLIHFVAGLARTDKESATVIFLTLGSTTARLSVVRRLAKLSRVTPACRDDVLAACHALAEVLKLRNHYNHCIYAFDENGSASTILMRVQDGRDSIRMGKTQAVSRESIVAIEKALADLRAANTRMWAIITRHGFPR